MPLRLPGKNRIDPTAAPPPKKEARGSALLSSPWARRAAVAIVGAALGASCRYIPWPIAQAICVAVSSAVSLIPVPVPAVDSLPDGGP